jgi:hypothetical protein
MFLSMEFGMLSGPGALLLPRYLRHRSYVFYQKCLLWMHLCHVFFLIENRLGCAMDIV